MLHTGGHSGELSPDALLTAIDAVAYEEYSRERQPGYLRATDEFFFHPVEGAGIGYIWDEDENVGEFQETAEQEEILDTDSRIANQKTVRSVKWTKQLPISDEAFRADQVGKRNRIGQQCGDRARTTDDHKSIEKTYADAFNGSIHTTPDGQPLASNSHVAVSGVTIDNLETGSLTPDNLWTDVTSLANQKGQDGDAGSHVFEGLVLPFTLYKTGKEVMNSDLIANSAENNLNIFDTDYGTVRIGASIFLGSAYNSNSNANTSYHCISRNHMIARKEFYGLTTTLIKPEYTDNDVYLYRAKFHNVSFPESWTGVVSSNGSV